jgi:ATP-dependent helicase/nuclease subunit A
MTPDDEVVKLWETGEKRKKASAADIGIAYHRIMEFLDFARVSRPDGTVDTDYICEQAQILRDRGAVDSEVYEDIRLERIAGFFRTDLGKRAASAARRGTLRKEKAFTLSTVREGRSILVQGVIDCCFEEDGREVLIDYKSSFIHPGRDRDAEMKRIRREYRVQIDLYREAIVKGTGMAVSEAYLYIFHTGDALRMI